MWDVVKTILDYLCIAACSVVSVVALLFAVLMLLSFAKKYINRWYRRWKGLPLEYDGITDREWREIYRLAATPQPMYAQTLRQHQNYRAFIQAYRDPKTCAEDYTRVEDRKLPGWF
jgi:hypothetical protein